jgi:hypothetical protein
MVYVPVARSLERSEKSRCTSHTAASLSCTLCRPLNFVGIENIASGPARKQTIDTEHGCDVNRQRRTALSVRSSTWPCHGSLLCWYSVDMSPHRVLRLINNCIAALMTLSRRRNLNHATSRCVMHCKPSGPSGSCGHVDANVRGRCRRKRP